MLNWRKAEKEIRARAAERQAQTAAAKQAEPIEVVQVPAQVLAAENGEDPTTAGQQPQAQQPTRKGAPQRKN